MIDLDEQTYEKFIRTLDMRYRLKGYNVFSVMFPDKQLALPIDKDDHIIFTDISFVEHSNKKK